MIVVSNTSPLTNLAAIGRFELLHQLYGELAVPEGVIEELNRYGKSWPGHLETLQANWISKHRVQNSALVVTLQYDLDVGEAEAIALALELNANLVLMDEREGRRRANRLGLNVIGVVVILLEAKFKKQLAVIQPELDALRQQAGFYVSDLLYSEILKLANEH